MNRKQILLVTDVFCFVFFELMLFVSSESGTVNKHYIFNANFKKIGFFTYHIHSINVVFNKLHYTIFMFMFYTTINTFKKYNSNKIEFPKKNII